MDINTTPSNLSQTVTVLLVAALLVVSLIYGYRRGFLKIGLSCLNIVFALAMAAVLLPFVVSLVKHQTTDRDHAICFLIAFVVLWIVVRIVISALDLFAKLPVIRGFNQLAGAILGLAGAFIILWLACIVITVFSNQPWAAKALEIIGSSRFLSLVYNNNYLQMILTGRPIGTPLEIA